MEMFRQRIRKLSVLIWFIIITLLLSMAVVGSVAASPDPVTFYVDPSRFFGVGVDDSFNITVTLSDVVDLFLAEFYMSFDPAILAVTDDPVTDDVEGINFGDIEPYLDYIYIEEVNNDEGWLHVVIGRPLGVKRGFHGTVQVAKITFSVEAESSGALYLYDTRLKDVSGEDIEHTSRDGYFANVQYIYSCDENGVQKNAFELRDPVYVKGGLFPEIPATVDIYVVDNTTWADGQAIGTYVMKTTASINGSGNLPVTFVGLAGLNDILVDYDQDGVYDAANDAVDDRTSKPGATTPVRVPPRPHPRVALISDNSQLLFITSILDSIKIGYDIYNDNRIHLYTEDLDLLLSYPIVIFYNLYRKITVNEHSALQSYISYGGNLLVTGYDSLARDLLLADIVRSSSTGHNTGEPDLYVVDATHPIMNGTYGSFPMGYHISGLFDLVDAAEADTTRMAITVAELADGYDKIIATDGLHGKVVFWNGVGPSDWTRNVDCEAMFKNTLAWFIIRYEHELAVSLEARDFPAPGDTFLLRATLYNLGLNNETDVELQLLIDSAVVNSMTIPELLTGSSYTIVYLWTPTVETAYNITANAPPLLMEVITANNRVTRLIAPIPLVVTATVDFGHDTLNLRSKRRWITAYIELPEDYNLGDIDVSTIKLNNTISVDPDAPTEIDDYDEDGIQDLMVKFDGAEVKALLSVGEAALTITGEVNGIPFEGSDTISV